MMSCASSDIEEKLTDRGRAGFKPSEEEGRASPASPGRQRGVHLLSEISDAAPHQTDASDARPAPMLMPHSTRPAPATQFRARSLGSAARNLGGQRAAQTVLAEMAARAR
mmetsp:Transcript_41995/g.94669  ORF Transcript_41995/g.94669 Transcript_41995/m.94669 type:complete len:110 (-) Transcript_41995:21-350(-)